MTIATDELRNALICQMSGTATQAERTKAFAIIQAFKENDSRSQISSIFQLYQDTSGIKSEFLNSF